MSEWNDFLEMIADAITELAAAFREAFEIAAEKLAELKAEIFERDFEFFERRLDLKERREAALLAGQRAAARAQAYDAQMQRDKARRALRWRKRLHDDGGVPDW